jgi:hypothetical protein
VGFKSLVSWLAARSKDDVSTEGDIRKHRLGEDLGREETERAKGKGAGTLCGCAGGRGRQRDPHIYGADEAVDRLHR